MAQRRWVYISAGTAFAVSAGVAFVWRMDGDPIGRNAPVESVDRLTPAGTRPPGETQASVALNSLWRPVDERVAGSLPAFGEDWSEEGRVLVDVSEAAVAAPAWRVGGPCGH